MFLLNRVIAIGTCLACCLAFSIFNNIDNDTMTTKDSVEAQNEIEEVEPSEVVKTPIKTKKESIDSFSVEPEKVEEIEAIEEDIEIIEKAWTEDDLEMLACTIYREAGSDSISDETRLMVGCVVMNRVEHELYPDTLYEVLTQKSQYGRFHWTGVVWPERSKYAGETHAVQRAYEIAERVLNGERLLDGDYIFQAEFIQSSDYIYQDGLYFCKYIR